MKTREGHFLYVQLVSTCGCQLEWHWTNTQLNDRSVYHSARVVRGRRTKCAGQSKQRYKETDTHTLRQDDIKWTHLNFTSQSNSFVPPPLWLESVCVYVCPICVNYSGNNCNFLPSVNPTWTSRGTLFPWCVQRVRSQARVYGDHKSVERERERERK